MKSKETISRRSFLQGATASTLYLALGAPAVQKAALGADAAAAPAGAPITCGVIGTGPQGRALLTALSRQPAAAVKAMCDIYPATLNGAKKYAPTAATLDDPARMLDDKSIQAVFIATPSHQHRQLVEAAIQAGKHVYCEAPLAITIEEAQAIARAGKAAKTVFQVGLQQRYNPTYKHALKFVEMGALGDVAQARAQWHKKDSWRRMASTREREHAINWRLYNETSPGLAGEVGIHQFDVISWALRKLPVSVQGFGGIQHWNRTEENQTDDRNVADTMQCVLEYPGGVRLSYDATLANSFDGMYHLLMGADSSILLREEKGWMVKEPGAPDFGWEVYAHKDKVGDQLGISLVADASKQLAAGKTELEQSNNNGKDALYYSVEGFLQSINDPAQKPASGAEEGLQATVVALKVNEAITSGKQVTFQKEWFTL